METKEGRKATRDLGWGHGRRVDYRAMGSHGGVCEQGRAVV